MQPFLDSTDVLDDGAALASRLQRDGYLFLRGLLPKKPPVEWAELPVEVQRELQNVHDTAQEEGITERTLKKRVRQYLIDQYLIEE